MEFSVEQAAIELLTSHDRNPADFFGQAIDLAEQDISAVVYKFTDPLVLDALHRALLRDVNVQVLMDGRQACSANSMAGRLSSMGAKVRTPGNRNEKLHAKFMVVDRRRVYTGSSNWTLSARKSNMELLLKLKGTGHAERFMELFDRLWNIAAIYPDEGHSHVHRS